MQVRSEFDSGLQPYYDFLQKILDSHIREECPDNLELAFAPKIDDIYQPRRLKHVISGRDASLEDVLTGNRPVVILGKTGSGKSLYIARLILHCLEYREARPRRQRSWASALPILLDIESVANPPAIRNWMQAATFIVDYLAEQIAFENPSDSDSVKKILHGTITGSGRRLWLIGMNPSCQQIIKHIVAATAEGMGARDFVIMTCRPSVWDKCDFGLREAFSAYYLDPFDRDDFEQLYRKWDTLVGSQNRRDNSSAVPVPEVDRAARFVTSLYRKQSLWRAAEVPAVAKQAILWDIDPEIVRGFPLPEVRAMLYHHLWEASRRKVIPHHPEGVSSVCELIDKILPKIAYDSFETSVIDIPVSQIRATWDSLNTAPKTTLTEVLDSLCSESLCLQHSDDKIVFVTKAFREFLAGLHFLSLEPKDRPFEALSRISRNGNTYSEILLLALSHMAYYNRGRKKPPQEPRKLEEIATILWTLIVNHPAMLRDRSLLLWLSEVIVDTNLGAATPDYAKLLVDLVRGTIVKAIEEWDPGRRSSGDGLIDLWELATMLGWIGDPRLSDSDDEKWVWIDGAGVYLGVTQNCRMMAASQPGLNGQSALDPDLQSDAQCYEDRDGFEISKYLVTNEEYAEFLKETKHRAPLHWRDRSAHPRERNRPVVNVSYDDALAYCTWRENKDRRHTFNLPTEQQWMLAVRGSSDRLWPWDSSAHIPLCANLNDFAQGRICMSPGPSPVGIFPDGKGGKLEDVVGNVKEWVTPYERSIKMMVKGSSYLSVLRDTRCTWRGYLNREELCEDVGFRCVRKARTLVEPIG